MITVTPINGGYEVRIPYVRKIWVATREGALRVIDHAYLQQSRVH